MRNFRSHRSDPRAARMSNESVLPIWAIYSHPNDYPTGYVARPWPYGPQPGPESITVPLTSPEIESLRDALRAMGLTRLMRKEGDDSVVVEMWA